MAKRYSEVEIEKGLIAAATLGIRPAAYELGIPPSTVMNWIREQPERYAEIREQEAPKWRARAAAGFEDVVDRLTDLEHQGIERLTEDMPKLEAKDLARTIKDLSTSKGINTQHVNTLRGQPTQVVEHRYDVEQVGKLLARFDVESTAVEDDEIKSLPPAPAAESA